MHLRRQFFELRFPQHKTIRITTVTAPFVRSKFVVGLIFFLRQVPIYSPGLTRRLQVMLHGTVIVQHSARQVSAKQAVASF